MGKSIRTILSFVRKELTQARRDPSSVPLIFIAPLLQLTLFGYAVATNIKHVETVVLDHDHSSESRRFLDAFERSGYFRLRYYAASDREVEERIQRGDAVVGIRVPRGFGRHQKRREPAPVQFILDGSDSNTAAIVLGYGIGIAQQQAANLATDWLNAVPQSLPAVDLRSRVWYNADLDSVNFIVPGIICTILSIVTTVLSAQAIVREKERGTLEQLLVTPVTRTQFILGKLLPFMLVGYVDVFLILTVGTLWFGVPHRGSIPLLYALTSLFLLNTLGMGLLISTVTRTQGQAQLAANFLLTPWILLSGFVFPIENMPYAIQLATYLVPLRYFLVIVRGIMLKGLGLAELWTQVVPLAALGAAMLTIAVLRFNKRVT